MRRRRQPGRDRGAFTAEFAAGLPALMLLLVAGLTAVTAVTTEGQCVDAAREAALAQARGEPGLATGARVAPPGARITVDEEGDAVVVVVSAPVRPLGRHLPAITVRGRAVAALEPAPVGT